MTCPLHGPQAGAGSLVSMGLTLPPPIMHSPAGLSIRVPHPLLTQTSRGTPHRWPSLSGYCESVYGPSLPGPQSTCSFRSHQPLCGLWEPHRILPECSFELKLGNLFLLLATRSSGCLSQAGDKIHETRALPHTPFVFSLCLAQNEAPGTCWRN